MTFKLACFLYVFLFAISFSSTTLFAQDDSKKLCIIGSSEKPFYINNFENLKNNSVSPLIIEYLNRNKNLQVARAFQKSVIDQITNPEVSALTINTFNFTKYLDGIKFQMQREWISKKDLSCALRRVPNIRSQKALCENSDSIVEFLSADSEIPCINDEILDYVYFVINQAFRCFDHKMDDYSKDVLVRKINLESAFGFFFADKKGKGISQIVSDTAFEMNDPNYSGYKYLLTQMEKNPESCKSFIEILKSNPNSSTRMNTCGYVNLEDGIGRSIITGLGTYFYYRDDHPYVSANKLLKWLGVNSTSSVFYKEMRSILALGMYNKGPGTVDDSMKFNFEKNELSYFDKKPKKAFDHFINKIKNTNFYIYIQDSEDLYGKTYASNGTCRI